MSPGPEFTLPHGVLDRLLPMHIVVRADGTIEHAAPTFRRICPAADPVGLGFFDLLEVERPLKLVETSDPGDLADARLRLRFRGQPGVNLNGLVTVLSPRSGYLVDLSFGIAVVSAVAEHGLTVADFAPSGQTVEMLYLAEANAVAMAEARRLIDGLELARDAARTASLTDGLTGLGNRRALDGWLAARARDARPFALMQVDLDYFKLVNDTHGHGIGDAVLKAAARRLLGKLRPRDDLARVGGDEFVALVEGPVDEDRLKLLADRLIAAIEKPVSVGRVQCRISASIGVAVSRRYGAPTLEAMLAEADRALYAAKRTGRGRARILAT